MSMWLWIAASVSAPAAGTSPAYDAMINTEAAYRSCMTSAMVLLAKGTKEPIDALLPASRSKCRTEYFAYRSALKLPGVSVSRDGDGPVAQIEEDSLAAGIRARWAALNF